MSDTHQINYTALYRFYARRERYRSIRVYAATLSACAFIGLAVTGCIVLAINWLDRPVTVKPVIEFRHELDVKTGFPSIDDDIFPDPPCPWCGEPMDGHSCTCNGEVVYLNQSEGCEL